METKTISEKEAFVITIFLLCLVHIYLKHTRMDPET